MLIYSLLLLLLSLSAVSQILSKKFQLSVSNDIATMLGMNIVNAIFGIIYFFFLCKFDIDMNLTTLIFSVLYALLVINSFTIAVVALSKMSILMMSVVGMAGTVFGSVQKLQRCTFGHGNMCTFSLPSELFTRRQRLHSNIAYEQRGTSCRSRKIGNLCKINNYNCFNGDTCNYLEHFHLQQKTTLNHLKTTDLLI